MSAAAFRLDEMPASVLVIVTRRIGDVLLTAPLVRSLKAAWPQARIDLLVFRGTEGVLAGDPDIGRILVVPDEGRLKFLRGLRRRYDLAVSTSPSDRPTFYAWLAGRRRIGVMTRGAGSALKRALLDAAVEFDNLDVHTVVQNLLLADLLGLPRHVDFPLAAAPADEAALALAFPGFRSTRYAVLHLHPKFTYKMWHDDGWRELARWLQTRGLAVVLTGGADAQESRHVRTFAQSLDAAPVDLSGRLDFRQLALLLRHARLYVGPDTVTTHLAAAVGTPSVALFGPSNPVKWGPWPGGCEERVSPYVRKGTQRRGNVALVQGGGACVPCLQEGCARHVHSESVCLQMLPAATVIDAAAKMLGEAA
ncbi:MAG TPA: glycosyltransferase family 9 protein [Burkholderiales bacterium]|nr:glycosyltransferase family 9 protein [Burkholderiales bacterium]